MQPLAGICISVAACLSVPASAQFTVANHTAGGSGSAQLDDGGLPVTDADNTIGPGDLLMSFSATDETGTGPSAASASGGGSSQIYIFGEFMSIFVELDALYAPSSEPDGDRPGGSAEARLSSVIEFYTPAHAIDWSYFLDIDATPGFSGSANVVVENVTRAQTLLVMNAQVSPTSTLLSTAPGDLIRISTELSGSGSALPDVTSLETYSPTMRMDFLIVPEPATFVVLAVGALVGLRRPRARPAAQRK
jgi:hypothetical protein